MALNIKNLDVDRLARRSAELRETSLTEAVHAALQRDVLELEKEREARIERRIAASLKIVGRMKAAPVLDARSGREIREDLDDDILDSHSV